MLVYGDRARTVRTAELLDAVAAGGPNAFFDAVGLAQGLIDAEFEALGEDDLTPLHGGAMDLLLALARGDSPVSDVARLRAMALPGEVQVATPEGYAFYAVYPEAYRRAAETHPWREPPLVIGLRSIGTGLAAVVAAAAGASSIVTVRPGGQPFARELRLSPALCAKLAAHPGPFAIVDEGPGLSGSSFGCVADVLEKLGVGPERIVFLPSHAGDLGPRANPRHRARWATAERPVRTLDDLLAETPLQDWFADLIGDADIQDLSAGRWRDLVGGDIPADPRRERRKFRLTSRGGIWLARFAGLGSIGEEKWARAQALHAAGFAPEPVALRRGFLLQRWESGEPLNAAGPDRTTFLAHLARYLAFRARDFPARRGAGADGETLAEMARINGGLRLTPPKLGYPVHIDGRLHAWEWLRRPDGSFCKLDALDHSCGHDLVGCQDIAWDVAGAAAEFELTRPEVDGLIAGIAAAGGPAVDPATLAFFEVCYPAFQLGLWSLARAHDRCAFYGRRLDALRPAA